jgi:hypothetical protein
MYVGRALSIRRFVREQYVTFRNRGKSLKPNAIADFVSRGATSDSHLGDPGHAPKPVRLALGAPSTEQLDLALRTLSGMLTAKEDLDTTE